MHHKGKDHFLGLLLQPYHQLKIGITIFILYAFIKCNYRRTIIMFFHLLFDPEKDHVLKTEYDCIRKTNLCL